MPSGASGRRRALDRYDRATAVPVTVIAFVMVPVLVVPLVWHLDTGWSSVFDVAGDIGWALFTADYAVRVTLAPDRRRFVRTHLLDLAAILLWVLRWSPSPGDPGAAGRALAPALAFLVAGSTPGAPRAGGPAPAGPTQMNQAATRPTGRASQPDAPPC